jgi:hypothetical protein
MPSECQPSPNPLLCNHDLPSPPIVIPSETPTVLNCHPIIPCFWTASFTVFPRSRTEIRAVNGNRDMFFVGLTVHAVARSQYYSLISQISLTCKDCPPTGNSVSCQFLEGEVGESRVILLDLFDRIRETGVGNLVRKVRTHTVEMLEEGISACFVSLLLGYSPNLRLAFHCSFIRNTRSI